MSGAVKFCTKCGAKLREVRFCEACGAAVGAEPPPPTPPPAPPAAAPTPAAPAPAAMPGSAMPAVSSRPAASRSCFGIFAGWVIVIGAIFWMLPEAVRYLQFHFDRSELLFDIIASVLCFAAGCVVIGGAERGKLLLPGILALIFGAFSVYDLLGRVGSLRILLNDPALNDAPIHTMGGVAFGAGSIFGDFLIALGCLFTLFAWMGSALARK